MNQLENLNLTEQDFDLISEGLDLVPDKHKTGELLTDLLGSALIQDEEERKEVKLKMEIKRREKEAERRLQVENIRILQGKLFQLKRFLKEKDLLQEANGILNK